MKKNIVLYAAMAVGLAAAQSRAATLTLSDNFDAQYDNSTDFTLLNSYSPGLTGIIPFQTGTMYEIPVYFSISNLQTGESGFGNVALTVTTAGFSGGSVTLDQGAGYIAENQTYTSGKATKAYWSVNQSTAYTTAEGNIVASISGGVTTGAPLTMGVGSPFLIGWIYVDPRGSGGTVSVSASAFSTNNSGTLTLDSSGSAVPAATIIFAFPEPGSLYLAGIGALGLLARRRRPAG